MSDHKPAEAAAADAHAAGTARLLAAWRAAVPAEIAALEASNDLPPNAEAERVYQQALGRMRDLAAEAWARPVAAWADVRLRAEIGHHALYADYHGDGARRFEAVLAGKQPAEDQLTLGAFDERAVAELLKAVMWAPAGPTAAALERAQPPPSPHGEEEPASGMPKHRRDWLAMLRDAGPDGAAPDPRHAAIWGAILDLRGVRDAIENALEQMTAKLDRLADETTLTHAIVAGWEPEEDEPEGDAGRKPPA